jgi:hypothetical protein
LNYLGFKSVFRVADRVYTSSKEFTFKLDKNEELGMITPIWAPDDYPVIPGWTSFYLHLSALEDPATLNSYIQDIKASLLLFLRKLRHVTIDVRLTDRTHQYIQLYRDDVDSDISTLGDSRSNQKRYLIVKHITRTFTEEKKRENIKESEVVLAFPLTANETPEIGEQYAHAFLPLRPYGFMVSLHASEGRGA